MRRITILASILLLLFASCKKPIQYDLIIENARILDVTSGEIKDNQTILIGADSIAGIIHSEEPVRTKKVIDADGCLVVPGNIDTKTHLTSVFSSRKNLPAKIPSFLNSFYHKKFSDEYLPYGITTVLEVGRPEGWRDQTTKWSTNHKSKFVDLFFQDEMDSLYENEPLISIALKNFSTSSNLNKIQSRIDSVYQNVVIPKELYDLEIFRFEYEQNRLSLDSSIQYYARSNKAFCTSIHRIAEILDMTWFKNPAKDSLNGLAESVKDRGIANFKLFMQFVKQCYDNGVDITIGTDSNNGGKAMLSEQLILCEAGIPVSDVIKISSLNGAKYLGIDSSYGSIEVGKKADIVIFDQDPLENCRNFLSKKKVVKDGKFFRTIKREPGAKISGE